MWDGEWGGGGVVGGGGVNKVYNKSGGSLTRPRQGVQTSCSPCQRSMDYGNMKRYILHFTDRRIYIMYFCTVNVNSRVMWRTGQDADIK